MTAILSLPQSPEFGKDTDIHTTASTPQREAGVLGDSQDHHWNSGWRSSPSAAVTEENLIGPQVYLLITDLKLMTWEMTQLCCG